MSARLALLALILICAGCGIREERAEPLGVAYVGPAKLDIRQDLPLESPLVATLSHGDRVELIRQRRIFYWVRTKDGREGWTNERMLLSRAEMEQLDVLEKQADGQPSLGAATTFDALNVHTLPNRQAPSFFQIKEKQKIDVLEYRVIPRVPVDRPPLIPPEPKKVKATKPKEEKFPPMPAAPELPANWIELSKTPPTAEAEAEPPKPVPTDDWALVRTTTGEAGWVLSRRLYMSIPDEVAQYAEGRRITSYFSLGAVDDDGQTKHNWLWTTTGSDVQGYDYDSFRVFIWNVRRHRFETAYIDRKVKGYFPVRLLKEVQLGSAVGVRGGSPSATWPGFELCLEGKDGVRYWRRYAFIVNIVRFAGQSPCQLPAREAPGGPGVAAPGERVAGTRTHEPPPKSVYNRLKSRLERLASRLFRH